jgi:predicted nucleic acid-binding protein
MSEGFLFDTVTCSRWRRGDRILRRRIEALPVDAALYISVISVGELIFGLFPPFSCSLRFPKPAVPL